MTSLWASGLLCCTFFRQYSKTGLHHKEHSSVSSCLVLTLYNGSTNVVNNWWCTVHSSRFKHPPFSLSLLCSEGDERRPCSVIRCLSVLEGSSDRLQEAAFMPDDGDHRKQKCLFVPPGLGMSTISRDQYQILPSSSPNTHSWVRSGGILHPPTDKQPEAEPHTVVSNHNISPTASDSFLGCLLWRVWIWAIPTSSQSH